jgi:hypothetical protein
MIYISWVSKYFQTSNMNGRNHADLIHLEIAQIVNRRRRRRRPRRYWVCHVVYGAF